MTRLDHLRRNQNRDGGWGYFPGKQSWIEPTVYAALALQKGPEANRAWALLKGWQRLDGSWRPSADVHLPTWATALCVTLGAVRGDAAREVQSGAHWLLSSGHAGWGWMEGSESAMEPTAHSIVAIRKAAAHVALSKDGVRERLRSGETHLLENTTTDSLGFALLGLQGLGLQGKKDAEIANAHAALASAQPLTRAWITLALRVRGEEAPDADAAISNDLMLTALQALGAPDGNHALLRTV